MSVQDNFASLPISKELIEELDVESYAKKYRQMRFQCQETLNHLAFLKDKVKDVDGFWVSTLLKHDQLSSIISSKSDKDALSYLQHIELVQDPKDPRPFSLKFHFKENPYFSDSVLEKKYELQEGTEPAPADGSVTQSMRQFGEPEHDLVEKATEIHWKSKDKDLCAKHPRAKVDAEDDDEAGFDGDFGSFFWFFTGSDDPFDIGNTIESEVLPQAVDIFLGRGDVDDLDDEEDELEDEEDDEGSIDLEDEEDQPNKKKPKRA